MSTLELVPKRGDSYSNYTEVLSAWFENKKFSAPKLGLFTREQIISDKKVERVVIRYKVGRLKTRLSIKVR